MAAVRHVAEFDERLLIGSTLGFHIAAVHQYPQVLRVVGCPPAKARRASPIRSRAGVVQAPREETAGPEAARGQTESLLSYGDLKSPKTSTQ